MLYESDLLIVGAGPVGLFTAFQAGMLKIPCIVVDSLHMIGGQCAMLYPEKPIYDIPAYSKITGQELIDKLYEQMKPFNQQIILSQKILRIEKNDDYYLVYSQENTFKIKSIILATGGGNFTPNRPPLDGIEMFENKSIFYSITNTEMFRNKRVMIAGGGDSAVDWAIALAEIAESIYVVHRRNQFRAMQASLDKLNELVASGSVQMITPYQLKSLSGENGQIKSITLKDFDGNSKDIECDFLLPFFGIASNSQEMSAWGVLLTTDSRYIAVNSSSMETNLQGVFAVGDIAQYAGKLKLILTGFAEAALAVHSAFSIIYPDIACHFEHSTSRGIPQL